MNYAYLNADRDVLMVAAESWEIEDIQTRLPDVVSKIDDVPGELKPKMLVSLSDVGFHRLLEGSGGQVIVDYELLEHLDHLRLSRLNEVQDNTEHIFLERGCEWTSPTTTLTYPIACHQFARDDLDAFVTADTRGIVPYPAGFPSKNDGEIVPVMSGEELTSIATTVLTFVQTIKMQGESLKASIKAATTKAEIDAVVDER